MNRFRVGILTTLWQRHDLERVVLNYYADLDTPGIELVPLAVGSEGAASKRVADEAGWSYLEAPNTPLGAKHQAGLTEFKKSDVWGVIVIGSDDLLTRDYFRWLRGHIETGAEVFSLRGCFFYDGDTGEVVRSPRFLPGAGRYFSRSLLDRVGWRVWPDDRERYLDGAADEVARQGRPWRFMHCGDDGVAILDIKAGTNMWDFPTMRQRAGRHAVREHDPADWLDSNFPGIRGQIETITAQTHG